MGHIKIKVNSWVQRHSSVSKNTSHISIRIYVWIPRTHRGLDVVYVFVMSALLQKDGKHRQEDPWKHEGQLPWSRQQQTPRNQVEDDSQPLRVSLDFLLTIVLLLCAHTYMYNMYTEI